MVLRTALLAALLFVSCDAKASGEQVSSRLMIHVSWCIEFRFGILVCGRAFRMLPNFCRPSTYFYRTTLRRSNGRKTDVEYLNKAGLFDTQLVEDVCTAKGRGWSFRRKVKTTDYE